MPPIDDFDASAIGAKPGFAIFVHTFCQGDVPALYGENDSVVIFENVAEAEREIAEWAIVRLQQFLAGQRDFQDAVVVEEFILPVDVWPDGSIGIEDGRSFPVCDLDGGQTKTS